MTNSELRDDYLPTRVSLLNRLRNWDDTGSWGEFFNTYGKLLYNVARRAGLPDAPAQDVVQETIISVAKKLPSFNYDRSKGSFKSWLMTIHRRRLADHFRKQQYERDGRMHPREVSVPTAVLREFPDEKFDLAAVWDEEWHKNLIELATDKVRRQALPAQYQLFHLHVVKGLPARDVAKRLGVNLTQIYLAKYRISAALKKEMKRLEARML